MCIAKDKNGEKWRHRRREKLPHLMLEQIRENPAKILSTRYKEWRKCERDEDIDSATPQSNREMEKRTVLLESSQERNEIALRRRRKSHVQYKSKSFNCS